MKKLKFSLLAFALLLIFPLSFILSGCGATPKNEALGIHFESYDYDDATGYAIFEVDLLKATKLTYKINPSSWSGYAITYAVKECSDQNLSRFNLENGIITVEDEKFQEIKIDIYVNGYSDTCIVRLKQYPTSIYLEETDVVLGAGSSYTINPIGRFVDAFGAEYEKPLLEYSYNFLVETEDETIVNVPNENRLKIVSVRKNNDATKINITLLNREGVPYGDSFKLTINVTIVENAGDSRTDISGHNGFVKDGDTITINANNLEKSGEKYVLRYKNYLFSSQNLLIEQDNVKINCTSDNVRYVETDSENKTIYVQKGRDASLTFSLNMWSNMNKTDGSVYVASFVIVIYF